MSDCATNPTSGGRGGRERLAPAALILVASGAAAAGIAVGFFRPDSRPAGAPAAAQRAVLGHVSAFDLIERSGAHVRAEDLRGTPWIAGFIFTRCNGPCPIVSAAMASLAADLALTDVRLVTITVDPDYDTPAVLTAYARNFGADPERWLFLTGPKDALHRLVRETFLLPVQENEGPERRPGNEVTHSTRLMLVDADGAIRGAYDSQDEDSLADLRRAARELAGAR